MCDPPRPTFRKPHANDPDTVIAISNSLQYSDNKPIPTLHNSTCKLNNLPLVQYIASQTMIGNSQRDLGMLRSYMLTSDSVWVGCI